jgi:YD repeat-containing protein
MKSFLTLMSALCCVLSTHAQTPDFKAVSSKTPTVAGMGLYTEVPISHFTGSPQISIPLYEVSEGNFKMPISLNYHPSSVRVHSHPGWVGLGWSLSAGGTITRTAYGYLDERTIKYNGLAIGFFGTFSQLGGSDMDWCSPERLDQYKESFLPTPEGSLEAMPDEFEFNFLNYSGKFFMGHDGNWKVVSDDAIKVEFDQTLGVGFIGEGDLRANILDRISVYGSALRQMWTGRYFNKFTLVAPDGVRYEFGGKNATEYSVPYYAQLQSGPIPVTWHLTKISLPTGHEINLTYEPGEVITGLSWNFLESSTRKKGASGLESFYNLELACSESSQTMTRYTGNLMFPVYLKQISFSTGRIEFATGITTEMRYPTDADIDSDPQVQGYFEPIGATYAGYGEQRKWRCLRSMGVYVPNDEYWYNDSEKTKFEFFYSTDPTKRLRLEALQEKRDHALELPPYRFKYNPRFLPAYSEMRCNDHWDFFNGLDPAQFSIGSSTSGYVEFYRSREPDQTGEFAKAEVLEQIQYPTGGVVRFEYEPHMYSKKVDRIQASLPVVETGSNKFAGGLRIKAIKHFSDMTQINPSKIKEYAYVLNYHPSNNQTELMSSGVLSSEPVYYWPYYQGKDLGGTTFTYSFFSSGTILSHGYNVAGAHVGYSEVSEILKDASGKIGGYTKYKYSNFETDIWGQDHRDEIGISQEPSRSIYSPISSNEGQRGKLLSEEHFGLNTSSPFKTIKYQYAKSSNGYVRRLLQEPFVVCNTSASAQICFVTAFKTFDYSYRLVSKRVIEQDVANTFESTESYTYNSLNLPTRIVRTGSEGVERETKFKYPLDYTNNGQLTSSDWQVEGIAKLVANYMVGVPIEVVEKRNNLVTSATRVGYKTFDQRPLPHQKWTLESNQPLAVGPVISNTSGQEINLFNESSIIQNGTATTFGSDEHYSLRPQVINRYDSRGNPLEIFDTDGVRTCYIWSYKNSRPVITIFGVSYTDVLTAASTLNVSLTDLGNAIPTESQLQVWGQQFRTHFPGAQVTTFAYKRFNMSLKIDPNGRSTTYEYDYLGRLVCIKDHNGDILEAFNYHNSGQTLH